jgi:peptide-methionine (S)-S-oxide reductase
MPGRVALRGFLLSLLMSFSLVAGCRAATKAPIPAAANDVALEQRPGKQTAVFAGGCFWGTQSVFERVKGVLATTAGYAGGSAETATYDQVTQENTGHAESVRVVYDPSQITYGQLLRIFFSVAHDPPSSIARVRTWVPLIALPSSTPAMSSAESAWPTSRNWTPPTSSPSRL